MSNHSQNPSNRGIRPLAFSGVLPVFGNWFYWWRPPLTVRSTGDLTD